MGLQKELDGAHFFFAETLERDLYYSSTEGDCCAKLSIAVAILIYIEQYASYYQVRALCLPMGRG